MKNLSQKNNYLILIGGAEDKTDDRTVLKETVQKTNARNIVVIPTASMYPRDVERAYQDAFSHIGIDKMHTLDIRYRDEVDREDHYRKIEEADLIFFSGGDQVRLVDIFDGSQLIALIKARFFKGELSIAGTSAGAAAASDPMIYDGDYSGFVKGSVKYAKGFGFLPEVTIDTHFLARERIPRLAQFIASGRSRRGIGLDEDTGIVIGPNLRFEVIGSGMATVLQADRLLNTNYKDLSEREIINTNHLRIGFLSAGSKFSIKRWSVLKFVGKKKQKFLLNPAINYNS